MIKVRFGEDIDLDTEEVILKHGRYTQADARADAEAFEKAPGQPSLGRGTSPQVAFRVPTAVKEDLAAAARNEGRPEAQILRQALVEYLERKRGA